MSRKFLKQAEYSVHKLLENATDISIKTKADYKKNLKQMVSQLHNIGVQISHIKHFKANHVGKLINQWQKDSVSVATMKNRLSMIRYISKKINKTNFIPVSNKMLGIENRSYKPTHNKAIESLNIDSINDINIQFSVRLQQLFGLRREESIKFIPSVADKGTYIALKSTWTKGGVARLVPITTQEQRDFLDALKKQVKRGCSLIPSDKNYREQENTYVSQTRVAGFTNLHGLRHAYAQRRYRVLVNELSSGRGWECPINGGPSRQDLKAWQKSIDEDARLIISNELGHSRINITLNYLG